MKVRIVLVEPEGSINVGLACRAAKNFGVESLYIVNPKVDLEVSREFAAKGVDILERAKIVESVEDAIEGCNMVVATSSKASTTLDPLRYYVTPSELAERIRGHRGEVGILFGRESTGLTREEIERAHLLLTIPASPEYPVLNLSHAIAITLYELYKAIGKPHTPKRTMASQERIERLRGYIEEATSLISLPETRRKKVKNAIERVLFRVPLTDHEARTLTTFFRKVTVLLRKHKV